MHNFLNDTEIMKLALLSCVNSSSFNVKSMYNILNEMHCEIPSKSATNDSLIDAVTVRVIYSIDKREWICAHE